MFHRRVKTRWFLEGMQWQELWRAWKGRPGSEADESKHRDDLESGAYVCLVRSHLISHLTMCKDSTEVKKRGMFKAGEGVPDIFFFIFCTEATFQVALCILRSEVAQQLWWKVPWSLSPSQPASYQAYRWLHPKTFLELCVWCTSQKWKQFYYFFETTSQNTDKPGTCYLAHASLEIMILCPRASKCHYYRYVPTHATRTFMYFQLLISDYRDLNYGLSVCLISI